MRTYTTLTLIFLICTFAYALNKEYLVKISWQTQGDIQRLSLLPYPIRFCDGNESKGYIILSVNENEKNNLEKDGWNIEIIDENYNNNSEYKYYIISDTNSRILSIINPIFDDKRRNVIIKTTIPFDSLIVKIGYREGSSSPLPYYSPVIFPLPNKISLKSWLMKNDHQTTKPPNYQTTTIQDSLIISKIISKVSFDSLKNYIHQLSHNDLTGTSRTRYALSPQIYNEALPYIRDKMLSYLTPHNGFVEVIPFQPMTDGPMMYNIVGTLPSKKYSNNGTYIICGHYDSFSGDPYNFAPGADDNASGTACVLESARIFANSSDSIDFIFDIKFIAFSGEELGLYGSSYYANSAFNNQENILGVFNFDMIGYNHKYISLDLIGDYNSEWMINEMIQTNNTHKIVDYIEKIVDPGFRYSDHYPFWNNGYSAILSIENSNPISNDYFANGDTLYWAYNYYHTIFDTDDKINFELVKRSTQLGIATVSHLAISNNQQDSLPDLAIMPQQIGFDYSSTFAGSIVTIQFPIYNLSNVSVDIPFSIHIWNGISNNEILIEKKIIQSLRGNGTAMVRCYWQTTKADAGTQKIHIIIDSENVIKESNESNNEAKAEITLQSDILSLFDVYTYPNPAKNGIVNFHYQLSKPANVVKINIFSIDGTLVWEWDKKYYGIIENGNRSGVNEIRWNCTNNHNTQTASGVYIYKISAWDFNGEVVKIGKLAIVK